jgi:hypothetical protein
MKYIILIIVILKSQFSYGTFQEVDIIEFFDKKYSLAELPFDSYLLENNVSLEKYNSSSCSANWRGYIANWKIENDQLYLVSLSNGDCANHKAIALSDLFGINKIKANWFSGNLNLYVLDGRYQQVKPEVTITVVNGKII